MGPSQQLVDEKLDIGARAVDDISLGHGATSADANGLGPVTIRVFVETLPSNNWARLR